MALTFTKLLGYAAAFGVAGWALENLLSETPRYSAAFRGKRVPFLPVYALGGASVLVVSPTLKAQGMPAAARAATYAGILSGVEWTACQIDRKTMCARSWDYGPDTPDGDGCVDVPHAVAWGVLGLVAEADD